MRANSPARIYQQMYQFLVSFFQYRASKDSTIAFNLKEEMNIQLS